jgi:hypothetical protein
MQRRWRRPHQAAHATISDRLAFLGSRGGLVVVKISAGDEGAVINIRRFCRRHHVKARNNDKRNKRFEHVDPV